MGRRQVLPDHVRLRFLKSAMGYSKGQVIQYPRGPAKALIVRELVEIVEDDQPLLEVAMVEHRDVQTADAPRRRRKPK